MGVSFSIDEGFYSEALSIFKRRMRFAFYALTIVCALALVAPGFVGAEDGQELMDLFQTSAFSGSWEVFSKFNWLGALMNFVISTFCLIGIVLIVLRILITLVFKSGEVLWDKVYDLKNGQKGNKLFGFPGMFREVYNGNYGVGLDAAMGFLLSLLPDVKSYSDYNPEKMMYNLQEDDTITTYLLKISLPTIMALFVFAIGFNGILLQGFGNVVNAMAYGAKRLVTVDLSAGVAKVMGAGSLYSFSFNTKDELGKLKKNVASQIYYKILPKLSNLDTSSMQSLGSKIENWVDTKLTPKNLNQLFDDNESEISEKSTDAASKLSYSVTLNSSAGNTDALTGHYVVPLKTLGVTTGEGNVTTVHVFITKKANTIEKNYFDVKGSGVESTEDPGDQTQDAEESTEDIDFE